MKTACIMLSCLALLSIATIGAFIWLPASIHYYITEQYILSTTEQQIRAYLGLMVPKSGPYQRVRNVHIDWPGEVNREAQGCVEVVKLVGDIDSNSTSVALIEYVVSVSVGLVFWVDGVEACNLQPQENIESDHPLIKNQAMQVADGASIWDAYRIYAYTTEHLLLSQELLSYSRQSSALDAYLSGTGTCCEFARLMVALSRASGIPSRSISGIVLPDLDIPGTTKRAEGRHPGEAHAWVEFSNGYLWTMADPAWGSNNWRILPFARNDGRHLRYGGANIEAKLYQDLRTWATSDAQITAKRFAAHKYVLAADPNDVQLTTTVTVQKGWDGRWLNVVLVLGITTYLLCCLRDRYVRNLFSGDNGTHAPDEPSNSL